MEDKIKSFIVDSGRLWGSFNPNRSSEKSLVEKTSVATGNKFATYDCRFCYRFVRGSHLYTCTGIHQSDLNKSGHMVCSRTGIR